MEEPVFVIHGVANRDQQGFTTMVTDLQRASGIDMVPVYWGDLGADDRFVTAAVPTHPAHMSDAGRHSGLRDADETPITTVPAAVLASAWPRHTEVPDQWTQVEQSVRDQVAAHAAQDDPGLREAPRTSVVDEALRYLGEEWPKTEWLSRTDDPALLAETGRSLATALAEASELGAGETALYAGLRAGDQDRSRLRTMLRNRLHGLDRVAGAAIQAAAGRLNATLRTKFGPGTTRFLGDVLVYQRHREAVHARVRACIDSVDPALGRSKERPVRLVAHSLGGVIAVDMATASTPLWTASLVTFGSQAAFFHACDPRGGQLLPYSGSEPVALPPSLGRWTNLWEPLDMLAFVAARVFRLHDGSTPTDVAVPHMASTGAWTHSSYWSLPSVADEIRAAMGAGPSTLPE